jgi:trk system potassium uptake protein TrkA
MQANQPQHVCIMGCGRVGATLAERYFSEGSEVSVIDINQDAFLRLSEGPLRDGAILGDGTEPSVLEKAGIVGADIFIAVTNGDNRNIMAVQIAQRRYKVKQAICRIYDPMRHETYKQLHVHSICPTLRGAEEIYQVVSAGAPTSGAPRR